ncbi:MAG: aspartate--tRNA(Asn) ligase [Candidatus ainarchaeum sp.]|nr:aspartate--tRNA(Asn) ligase [Candidatus ainarchaeum sp.]
MKRIMVSELKEVIGKEVKICGFLHEIRNQSKIKFLLIRDISGIVQCVALSEFELFTEISKISKESVVEIIGLVKSEKQAPKGIEIEIKSFSILSVADSDLPIPVVEKAQETSLPLRLDYRWIDLRKPKHALIFKIWTTMEEAMREFWLSHGFIQIYSPKLMGVPSESGAELFNLDYFGKKAYLAQSPQLYKQMAMSAGFEKIFEIGPVFRANPSHTTRHDTEFTSIDMEISFIESHEDIMKFEEEWLTFTIQKIKDKHFKEIKEVFGIDIKVPSLPFPRIKMKDAELLLKEKGLDYSGDLDAVGEKKLCELIKEKYSHDFVFLIDYPYSKRPFYHMKQETDKNLTKSFDLLWKGLEITTGAQREHRYEILKSQLLEKGLTIEPLKDYMNFFKYGCPPHGGCGVSPTRLLMQLLELKNVREATFLPRDTQRLNP